MWKDWKSPHAVSLCSTAARHEWDHLLWLWNQRQGPLVLACSSLGPGMGDWCIVCHMMLSHVAASKLYQNVPANTATPHEIAQRFQVLNLDPAMVLIDSAHHRRSDPLRFH